ncbi:MAG: hypothetical protein NVSMB64_28850 [Candidatus Velthaea sp.]
MFTKRLTIGLLAAIFATGSSAALLQNAVAHATPALAAPRDHDDNEQGDQENQGDQSDHHDNGKHKGWYKHHKHGNDGDANESGRYGTGGSGRSLRGTIVSLNGNSVGVRLTNGQTVYVNDQAAIDRGRTGHLYVNEPVVISGSYGQDGVFYATQIAQSGTNGNYPNGGYGGTGNGDCNSSYANTTSVDGYETSAVDGNGYFQLGQSVVAGVPIPGGATYTVHVTQATCLTRTPGQIGQRLHVYGRSVGDGHTIEATRITG